MNEPIIPLTEEDIFEYWIDTEDIASIDKFVYDKTDVRLNEEQCDMVADIIFRGCRRALWNMFTRFGKSFTASRLIGIFAFLNPGKRVNIIGPQKSQAMIIMKQFTKDALLSTILTSLIMFEGSRKEKFGKKTSQQSYVLRNGVTIDTMGVHGEGKGAMGEGGDLNIVDEMGLIEPKTYREKVHRLLGDNSDTSILLGLFNPWSEDTIAAEFWNSGKYKCRHVNWKRGIELGRISAEYVEEQRELLTDIEFTVLFESRFPKSTIDTIVTIDEVKGAIHRNVVLRGYNHIEIGVDVARFGKDSTVIAVRMGYKCWHIESHQKEDTMQTAGRVGALIDKYTSEGYDVIVNIDDTGLGGGVTDRLKEIWEDVAEINGIINGSAAINDRYFNRISELWFWIQSNIHRLDLPNNSVMIKELTTRRYKFDSGGKKLRIESKDEMKKRGLKSPDVTDAVANAFASESSSSHGDIGGFI